MASSKELGAAAEPATKEERKKSKKRSTDEATKDSEAKPLKDKDAKKSKRSKDDKPTKDKDAKKSKKSKDDKPTKDKDAKKSKKDKSRTDAISKESDGHAGDSAGSDQEVAALPPADVPIDGLLRFPDFSRQQALSSESALEAARMGIPHWLAHPATVDRNVTAPVADPRFALSSHSIACCEKAGISTFFAVQAAVIPVLRVAHSLSKMRRHVRDLCVSAPTGSGKTLAFVLPIVEKLKSRVVVRLRALVVLPTKDLARQVMECFELFSAGTDLRIGLATGDVSLAKEQAALTDQSTPLAGGCSLVDILVCTPGRLIDHITLTPNFTLQHLEFWVLDEADRLLGEVYQDWLPKVQSFIETVTPSPETLASSNAIPVPDACTLRDPDSNLDLLARPPPRIQKLLFSATLTQDPAKIARLKLVRPLYIAITDEGKVSDTTSAAPNYVFPSTLTEYYATCPIEEKPLWLIYLLWKENISGGVCFTKSLETAHRLAQVVQAWALGVTDNAWRGNKIVVAEYSSDLPATERTRIMRLFKQGGISLLICSDIIARGMDIDQVSTVINYDVPTHMNQYTHRVGRTARAGREGSAYTLVGSTQMFHFKKMMIECQHWDGHLSLIKPNKDMLETLRGHYKEALEKVDTIYS
ncbi:ATP-dependent RNA helicase dbp6 [Coemansia thaxteri]|uniref:ATP-dependent RNA helicase n=1 Tax=Coemansia thaxteri TaxID=2663907 RepID=A0A9W8EKH0_9FUNG|nr:ATP-dependent RNA helicase dbp6 [Coemansia thaxteri]KAJ2008674.1 ATP-dependent RNA helicase dbp6 [Coemansia thaxteri]KAJ2472458.1 ATP-dependent RNA helicase dbp6 [Coemansia sp. RSA 2322]KAJ2488004.1 ATP-dependent RNA helicase dbp6 [Coemansia sp. RSA 2320]